MCRFCNKHWPTGGLSTYAMPSPSYEKNSYASRKKKVVRLGPLRNCSMCHTSYVAFGWITMKFGTHVPLKLKSEI